MAPRNLDLEEMAQVSGGWLDPNNDGHKAILAEPMLAPSLKPLRNAHDGVISLLRVKREGRLAEIVVESADFDWRHDGIIRGTFGMLTGMAELAGGPAGEELIALRDELVPSGLSSSTVRFPRRSSILPQPMARACSSTSIS